MTTYRKPSAKCVTKFCRGTGHPKRAGLCSKCSMRKWRASHPVGATLAMLRRRSKDKKIPFDLTLEWLTEFLTTNKYDSSIHHIDRIKTWLGYTMGNLQILPMSENIAKGNRERYGKLWMTAVVSSDPDWTV